MKRTAIILTIILTAASAAFAQKPAAGKVGTAKSDPAKEVRAAFDRLIEGIKQTDAEKVMSVYDKSERTLFFNNNGTVTLGWSQMRANRDESYAKTKDVTLDITGLRVEMLGPTSAYVTYKWKQSQVYDGKLENGSGRTTLVFKKIGTEWKVVHVHTSPDSPAANRPVLPSERAPETEKPSNI
ncbi:MAG: YybH family protein [Pyrinomonadaceae bacterium]